jgi:hypothetical protein
MASQVESHASPFIFLFLSHLGLHFRLISMLWVSLAASMVPVMAQIQAGKTQPDRVEFGTIRVGVTADASVRIFASGNNAEGVKTKVTAPPFVIVKDSHLGAETYGNLGTWLVFDLFLTMDTRSASNFLGEILVQIGGQKTIVPVHALVAATVPGLTRTLVVATPFDRYSCDNASDFSSWLKVVEEGKLSPWYLQGGSDGSVLRNLALKDFEVVLLAEEGLIEMQEKDVTNLVRYVETGGRVVLCANAFFSGTVDKANQVLIPFGLQIQNQEPRGVLPGLPDTASGEDIVADPLTREVKALDFRRASPIAVTNPKQGKILVKAQAFGGLGYVAVSRPGLGQGEVIALGQSLWWNWISDLKSDPRDNGKLLKNLLTKPRKQ